MKTYGGVEVQLHSSLISALNGGGWSASLQGHFPLGERTQVPSEQEVAGWRGKLEPVLMLWRREKLLLLSRTEPRFSKWYNPYSKPYTKVNCAKGDETYIVPV
jgi:hypothetical protein